MTPEKKYPTFVSHNQYGHALASAISLSQNEVTYDIQDLSEPLRTKLYSVIGCIDLTKEELHQINDVRKGVYRVGDIMMQNLLKQNTK